jgi:cyclohexadienyl dehydratase
MMRISLSVHADDLETIHSRGALRVGVSGDYQPFSVCPEHLTDCRGFDIDVAKRVATDLGVRLELVRFRWPELRTDLAAGKFDVAMSGVTLRPDEH